MLSLMARRWSLILFSFIFLSLSPALAQGALKGEKLAISVVLFTPADRPTYWSENGESQLALVKSQIEQAISSWGHASEGRLTFTTSFAVSEPLAGLKRCSVADDWKLALSILKLKSPQPQQKIISINPDDICATAGYAQVKGTFASIRTITGTTVAHELGHTLGFSHSATIFCPRNDFSTLSSQCRIEQYGDKTDLMGSGIALPTSKMSLAQSSLIWGVPSARPLRVGTFTFSNSNSSLKGTLFTLKTSNGTLYLELDDGSSNGGFKLSPWDSPGIEVRIVGHSIARSFTTSGESGIATLALARLVGTDSEGNCTASCGVDLRFHQGETFNVPGSKYAIKILRANDKSAQIRVFKR